MQEVKHLEDLLASRLENGERVINKEISPLTAPGENYGSIMLRIDLHTKNEKSGKERTLNIVAKLVPDSMVIQKVFNTQVTYRNEYKFYAEIVPTLDRLLKNKGISRGTDFIAPFYGGRLNLDGSDVVNSDAVILMENLKSAGYTTGKKTEGFNLEVCKVVLDNLAIFHAAGIALKHQEPETFKEKLEPYFYFYIVADEIYNMIISSMNFHGLVLSDDFCDSPLPVFSVDLGIKTGGAGNAINKAIEKLGENGFSPKEVELVSTNYKKQTLQKTIETSETWGTIIHYDSWTNNFLIKYEDTKPVHAVLVDFQVCDYNTPLCDVMFFLFTSVQQDIFEESLDPLLEYYYKQLLGYLKIVGVNTQLFTKTSYEEEIKLAVRHHAYAHSLWMLIPIMHEAFKSVEDATEIPETQDWSEQHVRKILQITRASFKRGWLRAE